MKTMSCLLVAFVGLLAGPAHAQRSGTGVGIIVGEPSGVTLKHWVESAHAITAAAAWSFSDGDSLQLHADYLLHRFDALAPEVHGSTALYYGLGAGVRFHDERSGQRHDDETTLGIRVPVGLDFYWAESRLSLFVEFVPVLEVAPSSDVRLNAAFGVRYFFR
ncbi:MAG TPA: hypothetical protein PKE12_15935 [Kiritimatiellia bacterium]|nr:hypothetical protein [Kiritimatiellia bacterium]